MHANADSEHVQAYLRPYQPSDLDALWRLDQVCFEDGISYSKGELDHHVKLKTAFTVIAEAELQNESEHETPICGFIIAHRRRGGYGHILTIDVDPYFRKRAVGTLLLNAAHERLAREGCHTVFLETAVNNVAALAFYKKHGYNIVRTIPRYYHATGMDAFLLSVALKP
ncbi:GCN5-related N-acetyltransferase [Candidatus Koribacter versatilis Ellin345]|uniref:N-alpha-acetyltransferase 60 n=1 Tax=Koribacter versatilis (strain Ellin345) TaxID=204669 RepID=Q1IP84_KORVE|nr:N-acetyltransferase [Candidatus Koribacter versatilis]ABF41316.1 GCN5-related N-acetyltransferase [Candidatus Koribacter versatilis Ellin345]